MTNRRDFNRVDRFLSEEMTEDERKQFLQDLEYNPELLEETKGLTDLLNNIGHPESFRLRRKMEVIYARDTYQRVQRHFFENKYFKSAVAALIIVMLVFATLLIFRNTSLKNPDSDLFVDRNPVHKELSFPKYFTSKRMGLLLESYFRGQVLIQGFPSQDTIFRELTELNYSWESSNRQEVVLSVYNNREKLVVRHRSRSESLIVPTPEEEGVYYWMLEADENIILVGRFYINYN